MRIRKIYPTISTDKLQKILGDPNVRVQWEDHPVFKVISEDATTFSYVIHQQTAKPPVPMVSARDFVSRLYKLDGYFVKEDGTEGHINVRVPCDEPVEKTDKSIVRGQQVCLGNFITPTADGQGSEINGIVIQDLTGNVPAMVINKKSKDSVRLQYEAVTKFA